MKKLVEEKVIGKQTHLVLLLLTYFTTVILEIIGKTGKTSSVAWLHHFIPNLNIFRAVLTTWSYLLLLWTLGRPQDYCKTTIYSALLKKRRCHFQQHWDFSSGEHSACETAHGG